jgi:hypothetical protein
MQPFSWHIPLVGLAGMPKPFMRKFSYKLVVGVILDSHGKYFDQLITQVLKSLSPTKSSMYLLAAKFSKAKYSWCYEFKV